MDRFSVKGMQMRDKARMAWVLCALSAMMPAWAVAQDKLSMKATADLKSEHLWRGQLVNEHAVFQPGFSMAFGKLSGGIWGSVGLTDSRGRKYEVERMDYYMDWTEPIYGLEGVSYSAGFIYYDFPRSRTETSEIYGGLSFNAPLSPSVTCYYDTDRAEGAYVALRGKHSFENIVDIGLERPLTLNLTASLGWASRNYNYSYWGVYKNELNDLQVSANLPIPLHGFQLIPSLTVAELLGSDIKASHRYSHNNTYLCAGIGISKTF